MSRTLGWVALALWGCGARAEVVPPTEPAIEAPVVTPIEAPVVTPIEAPVVTPIVVAPIAEAEREVARSVAPEETPEAIRGRLAQLRWERALPPPRPHVCIAERFVLEEEGADGAFVATGESFERRTFDARGLLVRLEWNDDAPGLSGEIRYGYDRLGDRTRTTARDFESIDGGAPAPIPPLRHRTRRHDGVVTVSTEPSGDRDEIRFDASGRVAEYATFRGDDAQTVRCRYDDAGRVMAVSRAGDTTGYVYEDDRLVAVEHPEVDVSETVWSFDGGFLLFDGEAVSRYRGSCESTFFDPCDARAVPLPTVDAVRPAPAPVRFGRPL